MDMMMALPEEIRTKIFKLVPQDQVLNARLVCKAWNQEIQDNYEYCVDLNEDSLHFNSKLQLRAKRLIITQLETTPVMNPNGTSIFSHPNAVKELLIGGIYGDVAQLNLHLILGLFEEHLVQLYLNINSEICNYRFPPSLAFNFKKLKTLFITSDESRDDDNDECEDNPRSLLQVLENSSFPKLEALKFDFEFLNLQGTALQRIITNVLRLVSKHGKFLEYFYIDNQKFRELTEIPDTIRQQELFQIKQIQNLEWVFIYMPPVNSGINRFWNKLVSRQKILKRLNMEGPSPIFSTSLVQQIVGNNYATLESLQIRGLCIPPTDPPFDLSIFQNCSGLKRLQLEDPEDYNAMILRPNPVEPDVINFHRLPENIKILIFKKYKILSEEILIAFQANNPLSKTQGFQKLKKLSLTACGDQSVFGINAVCLHEIMLTPRPQLVNVDFRFGGIHERDASVEVVLAQLGLSGDEDFGVLWDFDHMTWRYYF